MSLCLYACCKITNETKNTSSQFERENKMKTRRWAFVALLSISVMMGTVVAAPTEDCAKVAENDKLTTEITSKFSQLHGGQTKSPYGHGGYNEARRILEYALRSAENGYNSYESIQTVERAVRDARRECEGSARRFVRMLDVFARSYKDIMQFDDKLAAMRGGLRFLTTSSPTMMTKDLLTLGVAMTRPAMSNYYSACQIMDVILREAARDAGNEEKQWQSLLAFGIKVGDNLHHFQSKYAIQSRIARAIVDALQNEAVFLKALAEVASMNLNNSWDQFNVIITGLKQYAKDVPADNHRQAVGYLIAAGEDVNDKGAVVRMYQSIMPKLVGLNFKTPGYRIILRAGLDLSNSQFLTNYDRCTVATIACKHSLRTRIHPRAEEELRYGLREADHSYDMHRKLRVLQDYMNRAVRY